MRPTELLSPAGDFETALAAFDAGADAVYCGLPDFSARAFAKNLSLDDLRNLVRFAHAKGRKVYVTFNTLVDEADVASAVEALSRLEEIGPDALIVQDLGVARICRRHFPGLKLHASTQLVAHNLEGVMALKELGFTRVVLARELSLAEIASISKRCGGLELECFIHGALCYSISGLCLFGAMEKGRSGNRGKCPYCCRMAYGGPSRPYIFSMKDLRLGEDVRKLVDAGVVSLKIEGRMKSALYVAAVTKFYRQILQPGNEGHSTTFNFQHSTFNSSKRVTLADLETIFSRRTTELYFDGKGKDSPIDPESLGHLGAPIGTVKRVTKDREGRRWLRFHTARALEVHDGLQFDTMAEGRHLGLGIREMRPAISRTPVFEVSAGTDVEIELPEDFRFRPGDYPGTKKLDVSVTIGPEAISAATAVSGIAVEASVRGTFAAAKNPEKTYSAVEKAFSKLGETDYVLGSLNLVDTNRLFAPMGVLNDLRRELVKNIDYSREKARLAKVDAAIGDGETPAAADLPRLRTVKVRLGQKVPAGEWDEVVVAVNPDADSASLSVSAFEKMPRLAVPVYTAEPDFGKLRVFVKRLHREGFEKWEASDLATLKMLKAAGITDITADWTLYAFNSHALAAISELGVRRFVASPENTRENLQYLAESGYDVEFLAQQATPLFISLTEPAGTTVDGLAIFRRDGLWVTTRPLARTFDVPGGSSSRIDLSWDPM